MVVGGGTVPDSAGAGLLESRRSSSGGSSVVPESTDLLRSCVAEVELWFDSVGRRRSNSRVCGLGIVGRC